MSGVSGVFSVQVPLTARDPDLEIRTGHYLIEAAQQAGVDTIVHTSVARADEQETFVGWDEGRWSTNYWNSKSVVNGLVRSAGLQHWAILKPAFMMDNFIMPKAQGMFPCLEQGLIETALDETTRLDLIAAADVGRFAAEAFADPNRFHAKEIVLAADSLTMEEVAKILSEVSGKRVSSRSLGEAEMVEGGANAGLVSSHLWANVEGYKVDIAALAQWNVPLTGFADWIAVHTDRLNIG